MKHLRRHLLEWNTASDPIEHFDVVVIGSGVAGLSAALSSAAQGAQVCVLTKNLRNEANTYYAQGGIAVVLRAGPDTLESHVQDTLSSGKGLCDESIVRLTVTEGARRVQELIENARSEEEKVRFDTTPEGELAFTQEGGHSWPRILHADGDFTGREIERVLLARVDGVNARREGNISIRENTMALDLLTDDGAVCGVLACDAKDQKKLFMAKALVLATGGAGQLYRETTNPAIATGDGLAMAYRAGAVLRDLEFVQFHPTTLYVAGADRVLITEAARGEGALLKNKHGHRFMPDYHPMAELASRDVVSVSIVREMKKFGDTSVFLDMTHIPESRLRERFPNLFSVCAEFGIDPCAAWIPVRPAVHYMIGGVESDGEGQTSLPGLFAAGEAASNGFHGANRLGSNSLLEGLVHGQRAGKAAAAKAAKTRFGNNSLSGGRDVGRNPPPAHLNIRDLINSLKALMWREVGVEREERDLREALSSIEYWSSYVWPQSFNSPAGWILQNMLCTASLIAKSALERTETRGSHQRLDHPAQDDEHWKRHLRVCRNGLGK